MPDSVLQTSHDNEAKVRESMNPQKSLWMAHWMQTSCNSAPRVHNHSSIHDESKEDGSIKHSPTFVPNDETRKISRLEVDEGPSDISEYRRTWRCKQGLELASDVPKSTNRFGMVVESRMNSQKLRSAKSEWKSFPMFDLNEKRESILDPKKDRAVCDGHASESRIDKNNLRVLAITPTDIKFPESEYNSQPDVMSFGNLLKHSLEVKNKHVSKPLLNNITGSTSNIMPNEFDFRGKTDLSLMHGKEDTYRSSTGTSRQGHLGSNIFNHVEHENCNYSSFSTFLACDKRVDDIPNARNSGNSRLKQKNEALQPLHPSTSNFHFPHFVGEQVQRMYTFSGTGCLPSHSTPEVTKSEELNHESLHRMPTFAVQDKETLRICSTVNSVEGLTGTLPKFSPTTHHMLITEKTDVSLSKGGKMMKESTLSTEFKGNAFHKLLTYAPKIGFHDRPSAKLQPLENSMDIEEKKDVQSSTSSKNESSAETDTMDLDACQTRDSPPGAALSRSIENLPVEQNLENSQATVSLLREKVGKENAESKLFDINQEPPALSDETGSGEKRESSESKTESLGVENLFCDVELPDNSVSRLDTPLSLEPNSRWVKRLKLTTSDSPNHGTKMEDSSSNEKVNNLFGKIMKYRKTSSELILGKRLREGQELDKTLGYPKNDKPSSMDSVKKHLGVTLSHPWILRWRDNQGGAPRKKPEADPQSSKVPFDEVQRKQFPSIGAMALMGKAMNGFGVCEFRKRGSSVVWNTK